MLKTERLTIRKIDIADADFIRRLVNTEGWLKFIGDRKVNNIESAQKFIKTWALDRYNKYDYGPYLILLNKTPIGVNGLFQRDYLNHPDLGFAFLPEYGGQNYAYESSLAIIKYARTLDLKRLGGITASDNRASKRLLEKLGFQKKEHQLKEVDLYYELEL